MSKTAVKLRLGPLPRNEVVRPTISLSTDVKARLDRYAALHTQLHGEKVDAVTIIPHMLFASLNGIADLSP